MDRLRQDVRFATRQIGRSPVLSLVAVLVLTLGIGTSTLVFTVLDGVLMRAPPGIEDTEGIVEVWSSPTGGEQGWSALTYREFLAYRDQRSLFEEITVYRPAEVALRVGEAKSSVRAEMVGSAYFAVLDLAMEVGTGFTETEERGVGRGPAQAVLGHAHWQSAFGEAPDIVGRTIEVNDLPYTVVGVAPERFFGAGEGDDPVALWLPAAHQPLLFPSDADLLTGNERAFEAVARLREGIGTAHAEEVTQATWRRLVTEYPDLGPGDRRMMHVTPYRGIGSRRVKYAFAFVGLIGGSIGAIILLIACANVSGLLLARALGRRREVGIRLALGAGRRRIVQQFLTESVLLAGLACAVALSIVYAALDGIERTLFTFPVDLEPSLAVLSLTLGVTVGTGLAFGLVPALHATRAAVFGAIKDRVAGVGLRDSKLRKGFTVAQLALSLPLLTAAGLLVGQLFDAAEGDYGFDDPSTLVAVRIGFGQAGYDSAAARSILSGIGERVLALPSVSAAAYTGSAPLMGSPTFAFVRHPSADDTRDAAASRPVHLAAIAPEYFSTLGIPLLMGRGIGESDTAGSEAVAVIDQDMAQRLWPAEDPLGRSLVVETLGSDDASLVTVVGVAGRVRMWPGPAVRSPVIYRPRTQISDAGSTILVVRTDGAAGAATDVRAQVLAVDRDLVVDVRTLDDRLRAGRSELSRASAGAAASALVALLMACVGLYGMIATGVGERTREIGVRLALGADRPRVISHFTREGMTLGLWALAVGLPLSWMTVAVVGAGVVGVGALSPDVGVALVGMSVLVMAVALLASWLPARRTSSVDPVRALRIE